MQQPEDRTLGVRTPVSTAPIVGTDEARTEAAMLLSGAGAERALRAIVELTAGLLGTPSAAVALTDGEPVLLQTSAGRVTVTAAGRELCAHVARAGAVLRVADTADAGASRPRALAEAGVRAYLGTPLRDPDGRVVGAMCVFQDHPRRWTDDDVATLEHAAASAATQLEADTLDRQYALTDRLALLDAAAQAAGLGTFHWDLSTGALHWDASLLEAFQYDESTFDGTIDAFVSRVHPSDVAAVQAALDDAVATCGVYEAQFRALRPDGAVRWLTARGRAIAGPSGVAAQLIGVATDTTALREREEHVQHILEEMTVGYFWLDPDWRFGYVNSEAERILGSPRGRLLGGVIWELFPAAVGTSFEESYRRVARTGETVVFDAHYPAPLDAWYEVRAVPERGGVAAYFTDVTDRRRVLELAQDARARSELLASVSASLVEVLDPVEALEAILPHFVPSVADYAIASVLDEGHGEWRSRLRDVAALHSDPAMQPVLDEYRSLRVPALTSTSHVAQVMAGRAYGLHMGRPGPGDVVEDGPALDALTRLSPHEIVVMPLRGRGHIRGLITLTRGEERGRFSDAELLSLREVMGQIGLALDNAHLHAARRDLAEELQRSLLTPLPEPDHLHLVARYVPAATGAQIGGDWYDAFLVRDGSTALVIGDVAGHDLRAAVSMAQVRNVLRGGAHAVVQPPAAILATLDLALHDLAVGAISTAIVAKIERPQEALESGLRLLRWSSAGHPPPLLLHPDGWARLLTRRTDMLLGLQPQTSRHDHTEVIPAGATVLLYTDGLVERRDESLREGLERLRTVAERLAGLPLDDLCDRLVAELAAESEDDVALLAVRAHPEDRPRPAEAGPAVLPEDLAGPPASLDG